MISFNIALISRWFHALFALQVTQRTGFWTRTGERRSKRTSTCQKRRSAFCSRIWATKCYSTSHTRSSYRSSSAALWRTPAADVSSILSPRNATITHRKAASAGAAAAVFKDATWHPYELLPSNHLSPRCIAYWVIWSNTKSTLRKDY